MQRVAILLIFRSLSAFLFTRLFLKELTKINSLPLISGLPKHEYNYWQKLFRVLQPKESKGASSALTSSQANYSLGKRLSLQSEDDLPATIQTLSHKVEFTREFLESARNEIKTGPSIMKIGIHDYYSKITVVETNAMFHIFLLGTTQGKIKCVYMEKAEDDNKIDSEIIRDERLKREKEINDINASANTPEPIINDEFFFNLSMNDFIGHSSVITALSLKYNSQSFVSGSLDGELRVWDIPAHTCLSVLKDHFEVISTIKMSPRDGYFASAGSEQVINLWSESSSKIY